MPKSLRLAVAISFAASLGLTLPAAAQQHEQWEQRHPGPGGRPPGPPPGSPPGHPGQGPAFHPPGPPIGHPGPGANFRPPGGPGGPRIVHGLGERGYSFRGPGGVRREIMAFSPHERDIWVRGRWHHERRFGRLGYWYEVNGAWYFYDQPFDGPPTFVSEVEFVDPDLDPGDGEVVVEPAAPVVVAPAPVVVVPPAVCIGPLCVR
jgi:hypothetical protein